MLPRVVALPVVVFASAEEFIRSDYLLVSACLILDLRLPGMNGLQLQHRLAAYGHWISIIAVTAHGGDEARRQALEAGAVAFLRKPVDPDVLLGAVKSALGGW